MLIPNGYDETYHLLVTAKIWVALARRVKQYYKGSIALGLLISEDKFSNPALTGFVAVLRWMFFQVHIDD